ncbi:hypothetical protein V1477_014854 [Vespula maculifrons]|uniref:Uncharacterized protein n=1 Tax=Vespula maculifrons TaxID=7453 RepID=A0ABD2BIM2_VESMC
MHALYGSRQEAPIYLSSEKTPRSFRLFLERQLGSGFMQIRRLPTRTLKCKTPINTGLNPIRYKTNNITYVLNRRANASSCDDYVQPGGCFGVSVIENNQRICNIFTNILGLFDVGPPFSNHIEYPRDESSSFVRQRCRFLRSTSVHIAEIAATEDRRLSAKYLTGKSCNYSDALSIEVTPTFIDDVVDDDDDDDDNDDVLSRIQKVIGGDDLRYRFTLFTITM